MITFDDEQQIAPQGEAQPPAVSLWGAGFRQNNDVANLMDYVTRPLYEPDPNFDFRARAARSELFQQMPDNFLNAQSEAEFDAVERRVAQEIKDRNALAAGGWAGLGVGLATGLLSPTILLPGGAAVRGGGVVKTAASMAAWSVVAVGAQEVVLQANQETRTGTDTAIALGAAAVLGGVLGGGIGYLTRKELERIAAGMVDETISSPILHARPGPIPDEATQAILDNSLSAAVANEAKPFGESAGGLAPSGGVGEALAHQSPVARNFRVEAPSARLFQAQISSGGLRLEGNARGIAGAESGAIEDRIGALRSWHARALGGFNKSFKERAVRAQSMTEFAEAVSRAIEEGTQHSDPAVMKAASIIQKELYSPTLKAMREVGIPGMAEISDEYAAKYLNRSIRKEFGRRNSGDLKQILYENSKEKLADSYQKRLEKVTALSEKDAAKAKIMDLPAQEIPAVRAQFEKDMASLPEQFPGETGDIAREVRTLRAEASVKGLSKEERKALQAEANQLEADNAEALTPFRKAEDKLRGQFSLLDHTRTAIEAKAEKNQKLIDDIVNMQMDSLGSVARQGQKLLNKIDRLEKDVPEAVDAFTAKIERSLALLEKAEARQAKLDPADASAFEATVEARRIEFANNIAAMDAAPTLEDLRSAVEDTLQDVLKRVNDLNTKRALRIAELQKKALTLDPAQVAVRAAELRAKAEGRLEEFTQSMLDKGAKRVNRQVGKDAFGNEFTVPGSGELDFDELAKQHAEITLQHLIGNDARAPGYGLMLERGPELARTLEIDPYRTWSNGKTYGEFLERDITKLMSRYAKTTAPDIEIYRKFGTLNPLAMDAKSTRRTPIMQQIAKEFQQLKDEAQKLPEKKRQKRLDDLADQEREFIRDSQVELDRLRHMRGIPEDPEGFFYRAGRVMQNLNTTRLLGRMALASVPDLARPIMKAGLLGAFRDGFLPLISDFKSLQMLKQELNYAGTGLDMTLHSRAAAILDTFTEVENHTVGERALQHVTNRIGFLTGMDLWNVQMQQFAGALLNGKMMRSLENIAAGKASKKEITFLAENNIDGNAAKLIWEMLQSPGGSTRGKNGVLMPNSESWPTTPRGLEARALYRAAIYKAVNDTIVMPGVERPNWVDASQTAKLIAQFRSFTLSSTTKVLVSSAQQLRSGDMAPIIGSIFSLALGAVSYYIWASLRGGDDRTKMMNASPEAWADEAIRRSGLLAVLGEVVRFGDNIPGIRENINFDGQPPEFTFGSNSTDMLGPSMSLIKNLVDVGANLKENKDKSIHALRNLMPLQNHFILSQAFDRVEKFFQEKVQ